MKCVNRNNETVKILGILFSYDKNLEQKKKNYEDLVKKKTFLKLWNIMRQLTLEERITVFKSLAVSKNIHTLLITKLHNNTIDPLYKIQKYFIRQRKETKIKHSYQN